MSDDGWKSYDAGQRPPDVLCQFMRRNPFTGAESGVFLANPATFYPEFNVAGLMWRPTGIGRMQLDERPELDGYQFVYNCNWNAIANMSGTSSLMGSLGLQGIFGNLL